MRGPRVEVANAQRVLPVKVEWLRRVAREALRARGEKLRLSVVLLDDRSLRRLHKEFLDDDTPTDVISFDLREVPGTYLVPLRYQVRTRYHVDAELAISAERAKKEARKRGVSPLHELALYLVHGILHLGGYRDATPAQRKRMRAAEKGLLARLGIPHTFGSA